MSVWVGIRAEDVDIDDQNEYLDIYDATGLLPPELLDEDGRLRIISLDEEIEAMKQVTGGFVLQEFESSDEVCGLGAEVFAHDWDGGVQEFDPAWIQAEINGVKPLVEAFFKKCGINCPVGVWCQTDYR